MLTDTEASAKEEKNKLMIAAHIWINKKIRANKNNRANRIFL